MAESKGKKRFKHPEFILLYLDRKFFHKMSDEKYIKLMYKYRLDKELDLKKPQTFNEKLQWLKLHDRKKIYTKMVDKYEAKDFISSKIGKTYVIPTLGIYDNFDDINFEKLPKQFVIKSTHDSGGVIICKNKAELDKTAAKKKINQCLKKNFYYGGREWPYKDVVPRIMIEQLIEDKKTKDTKDYKFFCFNGKVKFLKIDFDRFTNHKANYYAPNGKQLPFGEQAYPPDFDKKIPMPKNLKTMIQFAEKIANDIPFLRVDFYEVNGKLYFGELTFFPDSGFGIITPEEWDKKIGDMLKIKNEK